MVSDSLTTLNRKRVFDFAAQRRLPAIYEYDFLVRDGGLMSYGADLTESFERAGAPGRPHLQGRQSGRAAVRATDPLPLRRQPEDREGDGPRAAAQSGGAGRRGDRIGGMCADVSRAPPPRQSCVGILASFSIFGNFAISA